jgi:PAS domain S-box-containing protein
LEFDNKIYGVLSVTIPFSFVFDKEEESLFLELAGDISFALAAIEQEEQKMKAEELLRESEEFKRRIIDSSNDCIKVVDFEGNLLSMSIGGQKLLEIDDITVYINKSWIDFWKGQDYEDAVEAISQAKNGNVGIFTGYCATEKGTPKWWEIIVSPIKDAQGNVFRLLALSRDITERKHTEEALLATEIRYRSLFESSKDGILILDAETGIIVDVNPFLIELLGYSKDQFIDKAIWEIGFFKDIVANQDNFLELQNKEYIRYEDLPLETAEGRKINVEFVSNVYLVNNQKVIQCNIRDISERKLAEVEKMKAMKEIESLSRFPAENPNPVMRLSNECELLYANYAAQEIVDFCGITLGHTAPTFMCDLISEVLAHGSVKTIENQFGDKIWSMTIAPITNAGYVNIYCNDITERKKAELELRRSEEDLKASQRIAHIGSWRLDLATNEVFWTEELYNMYGFDPSVPPPPYTEHMKLFTPESWEKLSTALDNTAKTGIPYELELKTLRKDGSNGWMWVFGKTILDENGIKVGLMGAAQDITDRKKAEEALVHSHDLMRYVIENNNGAIAIHDKDLKYIYVSQRYLYDFKVKEKNIIGKHHYDVFPDLPQKWRDVHQKALCGVISSADNDPYPREDGSLEWTRWECRPWYEADGSIGGIIIYTEVITDRKLAEFALKESEERYSTIVNSSPNVILIHVNGIIKYVNNFGEKLFDYTQEEMIGKTPLDFLDDESIPLVTTNLQRRAEGEFVPSYEAKIITKSGEIRHVLIQATFIQYQSEKAFLVVLTDISELKKYEFEMEIAMKKAKESDNLKTAFLQNMSHEIRTPLNGILGFSKLLNSENLSREDIIDYTSAISLSGKRLLEVVNDILDISRIQTGQVIIENNQFSINSIFTDLQQFFSPNANLKNISLNCHLSEDDNTTIISDETKLYQILSNLINNSLKFTETGSIDYGYEFKENIIHFFVKDSGIGISSEFFDKIFERFTQGDMSISRGYEGAGLGLSICKGLVELLGGEIWIESEINKGTTVFFNLPLENSEIISQPEDIKLEEPKKLDARTVLIAEDDDVSFQYLQKLLEKLGLNVIRAKNGEQAVDMVKRIPDIVLIFMDIKMPVMGGLEATNLVKKINPDIPVIAQTAYAFTEERLNILSNGCDDYIAKPLDNRKVINIIEKYLK